jgi:hypothetical protein
VLRDLFPLVAAIVAAVVIYILRERRRFRTQVIPARPGVTMQEAWETWLASLPQPEPLPAGVPDALLAIEARAAASNHPRQAIRAAILDITVLALHLEAIAELGEPERQALLKGYEPGMDGLLREALRGYDAQWSVLRFYARLKYDDAVPDDWFHHFQNVARPYIREKVRLAREYLLRMDESAGSFAKVYDKLLDGLRREMLKTRPKKRFPPSDLHP